MTQLWHNWCTICQCHLRGLCYLRRLRHSSQLLRTRTFTTYFTPHTSHHSQHASSASLFAGHSSISDLRQKEGDKKVWFTTASSRVLFIYIILRTSELRAWASLASACSTVPHCNVDTASRNPLYRYRLIYSHWCPESPVIGPNQFACDCVIFVLLMTHENNFVSVVDMWRHSPRLYCTRLYMFLQSLTPSFIAIGTFWIFVHSRQSSREHLIRQRDMSQPPTPSD